MPWKKKSTGVVAYLKRMLIIYYICFQVSYKYFKYLIYIVIEQKEVWLAL